MKNRLFMQHQGRINAVKIAKKATPYVLHLTLEVHDHVRSDRSM